MELLNNDYKSIYIKVLNITIKNDHDMARNRRPQRGLFQAITMALMKVKAMPPPMIIASTCGEEQIVQ